MGPLGVLGSPRDVVWLNFAAPHEYNQCCARVAVTVTSARTNTSVSAVSVPIPLTSGLALVAQHANKVLRRPLERRLLCVLFMTTTPLP
jgi:hypothetical protein